jgi:hypothetical protein
MAIDPEHLNRDQTAAHQGFLLLFLRSDLEIFRPVAALVPKVADAQGIVRQTALASWSFLLR